MPGVAQPRIALIDDDPAFLSLMRDLLEELEGYDVVVCAEAERAYELVTATSPDLVLLDVWMGSEELDWTLVERLTGDPATRRIRLIICSAAIEQVRAREPLLQRDGIEVLPKPFDLDALLEKVRACLARGCR